MQRYEPQRNSSWQNFVGFITSEEFHKLVKIIGDPKTQKIIKESTELSYKFFAEKIELLKQQMINDVKLKEQKQQALDYGCRLGQEAALEKYKNAERNSPEEEKYFNDYMDIMEFQKTQHERSEEGLGNE